MGIGSGDRTWDWWLGFILGIGIEQWNYGWGQLGIKMTIDCEYWIDIDGCGVAGFMKN